MRKFVVLMACVTTAQVVHYAKRGLTLDTPILPRHDWILWELEMAADTAKTVPAPRPSAVSDGRQIIATT